MTTWFRLIALLLIAAGILAAISAAFVWMQSGQFAAGLTGFAMAAAIATPGALFLAVAVHLETQRAILDTLTRMERRATDDPEG